MPVYKVHVEESCERMLYSFLKTSSNEVFNLRRLLQTDIDIVENCVTPETLFSMKYTWLGSSVRHNLTDGTFVDVYADEVFTTYQANTNITNTQARLPLEDCWWCCTFTVLIRQQFAGFQLSRKEVSLNFGHERHGREAVYILWGADANDMNFGSPNFFPEEEVTNNYPPSCGPPLAPLGEDWSNSNWGTSQVSGSANTGTFYAYQTRTSNNANSQWQP